MKAWQLGDVVAEDLPHGRGAGLQGGAVAAADPGPWANGLYDSDFSTSGGLPAAGHVSSVQSRAAGRPPLPQACYASDLPAERQREVAPGLSLPAISTGRRV